MFIKPSSPSSSPQPSSSLNATPNPMHGNSLNPASPFKTRHYPNHNLSASFSKAYSLLKQP